SGDRVRNLIDEPVVSVGAIVIGRSLVAVITLMAKEATGCNEKIRFGKKGGTVPIFDRIATCRSTPEIQIREPCAAWIHSFCCFTTARNYFDFPSRASAFYGHLLSQQHRAFN